jgi:uncharacterized protein YndB with AHSA1/START domain
MAKIEASVLINRPVDEVFARLTDVQNWPQWNPRLLQVEQTSDGPMGVGTTFRGLSEGPSGTAEWTSEVTEYEPNQKMAQKMEAGPALIESSWIFVPAEAGTKLSIVTEAETGGLLKLAGPLLDRQMKKQAEENLARLKAMLETQ